MRNSFGTAQKKVSGFDFESEKIMAAKASSPNQVSLVWSGNGEVIAASPVKGDTPGSFSIDIAHLPSEFNLTTTINSRREKQLELPSLSEQTLYLTAIPDFSERTRILALDGEILALNDSELLEWLTIAEREMYPGTDNHPIFETSLEDTACYISRLPNGQVALTEVPRQQVEDLRDKFRNISNNSINSELNFIVETPLRAVARYFLTAMPEGEVILRPGKEKEVTGFLLVGKSGFSYGLWSPSTGLFSEYAFLAPAEISEQDFLRLSKEETQLQDDLTDEYIRRAFEQLFLQLSREKLEQMELANYAQIVWAVEPNLFDLTDPIAVEYSQKSGLNFIKIESSVDEAVAAGLLLGSFNFGNETVAGADILPRINLARDMLVLADQGEIARREQEDVRAQTQRNRTVFMVLAPFVLLGAVVLGLAANLLREQIMLGFRESRADAKTTEFKDPLDRRKTYENNLKWYQEFIKQVSSLRRQQPVGISLLNELNSNYPLAIDSSFYISEMKLLANTGVEIKGLARNKDAITSFLRALEFAGGRESGTKLFSNLTYEVQEGVATPVTTGGQQPTLPSMAGSGLTGNNPAPGIIAWSIKGNFQPMAEFLPPDPKKQAPPGQPNPNNPAANSGQNPAINAANAAANTAANTAAQKTNP